MRATGVLGFKAWRHEYGHCACLVVLKERNLLFDTHGLEHRLIT